MIDSGLGEDLTGLYEWLRKTGGLSAWSLTRQIVFSTGLKGIPSKDVCRVETLVLETLDRLSKEGLVPEVIDSALNLVEFRLRETHTDGYFTGQRGFALLLRALSTWTHGGDPLALVAFDAPLAAVKAQWAADSSFFGRLIREFLLDNPHRATLYVRPDPDLHRREAAMERARLEQARAKMDLAELQAVMERTYARKHREGIADSPDALTALPALKRSDLDSTVQCIPRQVIKEAGMCVLYHPLPTDGIAYLDLGFDLRALLQEDVPYAVLFGHALLEMGTRTCDTTRLAQRIGRFTGGIRVDLLTSEARGDRPGPVWLFLRGKATAGNVGELVAILREVLLGVDLTDRVRFRQIVLQAKAQRESALHQAQTVHRRLGAHWTDTGWAEDQLVGLDNLLFLRCLAREVESDWPCIVARLERIHTALVNRHAMLANVTVSPSSWPEVRSTLATLLTELPAMPVSCQHWVRPRFPTNEGFSIPSEVNYVGKGAGLFKLGYRLHGSMLAITRHLNTTWIWNKIRAQGGAYGGHASFDPLSGLSAYVSYQDPSLLETLATYDQTGEFLRHIDLDDSELSKSIIGAVGEMDDYQLPAAQGFTSLTRYLTGDDDASRQSLRNELLSTTVAHFRRSADILDTVRHHGHVVVLAAKERLHEANERRGGEWMTISHEIGWDN